MRQLTMLLLSLCILLPSMASAQHISSEQISNAVEQYDTFEYEYDENLSASIISPSSQAVIEIMMGRANDISSTVLLTPRLAYKHDVDCFYVILNSAVVSSAPYGSAGLILALVPATPDSAIVTLIPNSSVYVTNDDGFQCVQAEINLSDSDIKSVKQCMSDIFSVVLNDASGAEMADTIIAPDEYSELLDDPCLNYRLLTDFFALIDDLEILDAFNLAIDDAFFSLPSETDSDASVLGAAHATEVPIFG